MRMLDLVPAPGQLATHTKLNHCLFHYLATLFLNIYPRQQMCMSPETCRRMFQEQSCTQSQCPGRADRGLESTCDLLHHTVQEWAQSGVKVLCLSTCGQISEQQNRPWTGRSDRSQSRGYLGGGAVLLTMGAPGVQRSLLWTQLRLHSCLKSSGSIFCIPHVQSFNFLLSELVGVGCLLSLCGVPEMVLRSLCSKHL